MKESLITTLMQCHLCRGLQPAQIEKLLENSNSSLKTYEKGEFIFRQQDIPKHLYILISGRVGLSQDTPSGRRMMIMNIEEPADLFGEVYLFLEKKCYDIQAEALQRCEILRLSNYLFSHHDKVSVEISDQLQYNMMCIFAGKAYAMNHKIKVLAGATAREKIVRFLMDRQSEDGVVKGNLNREEMADYMNLTRPSLSRELGRMQSEGIVKLNGREIVITDQKRLESYL